MDSFLWPLKVAIAWVMVHIHQALVAIGLPSGSGIAWVLSIVGLTIVVRLLIMPLFVKQIRAQRGMQLMQPELKALQEKYKGKKDPASRQRQQEEMMALYRKHGTNPMASCLPILVQLPIFWALFRVLNHLQPIANGNGYSGHYSIGPLTQEFAQQVQDSTVFGAPLSSSFMHADGNLTVQIVSVILILAMSVSQWYTMAQITTKNMPDSSKTDDNPMMRTQKIMMTAMPIMFAVTGINFQIGVLIYWLVSNLWTMGQQFYTINRMPAPGSEAEKKFRARENAKRARKGLPSLEEEERAKAEAEGTAQVGGQRSQPVRKDRQKKGSGRASSDSEEEREGVHEDDDAADTGSSSSRRPGGLTDEEIARRRYERRARERKRAAQRRKAQNKKRRS